MSGAYLAVDPEDDTRWGAYWNFDADDMCALGYPGFPEVDEDRNPISAAEAAAVATTYFDLGDVARRRASCRDVIHWVDNTSALHSFVKGGSRSESIDRSCALTFFRMYAYQSRPWFEYVAFEWK